MKKILSGKLYDTDTAKQIGVYSNGSSDFNRVRETLYQKRTGEYFLHGEGGPSSKYVVYQSENTWGGGEKIMPLSYAEAQKWAEKHLDAETYQAAFGEISEDEGYTLHSIKLTNATTERLRRTARESGQKIYEVVEAALTGYLK